MRLGTVIGRVTLSVTVPSLLGARWLIVSPSTRDQLPELAKGLIEGSRDAFPALSAEPSLVAYDDLGGAVGQTIGFVEGREAACPFDEPTPVDAINAALVDQIFYQP